MSSGLVLRTTEPAAPTRDAFLREVLDAKPTPATPKFDEYTEGSYHVDKADPLRGLIDEAKRQKRTLRGVAVFGPFGPLWEYHVAAFIQEGDRVRVNTVVVPHARPGSSFRPINRPTTSSSRSLTPAET